MTWLENGIVEHRDFETFASAAGFAGAMHSRTQKTVMISADINESVYGTLYHYRNGAREAANRGFIAQVKAALQNR